MQFYDYDLLDLPVFKGLSKEQIKLVLNTSGATLKRYSSGQFIQMVYEHSENMAVLLEGRAVATCEDRFGNEAVNCPVSVGDVMGTACINKYDSCNYVTVESITDTVVLNIPYSKLLQLGNNYSSILNIILLNLVSIVVSRQSVLMERVNVMCQRTLRERIIVYLQQQQRHQKAKQVIVPGRVQMAKKMCCHRSALTRELSAMRDEGIIDFGSGWMRLLNADYVK